MRRLRARHPERFVPGGGRFGMQITPSCRILPGMTAALPRRLWLLLLWLACAGAAQALSFSTVVLDPGHGGRDGGAVWNKLVEKNLCLDVAKRVETLLKKKGLKVVMTRRTDTFVELGDRAWIANRQPRSIFVSIHFNASRNTAIRGVEVFYRSTNGRALASRILTALRARLKTTSGRGLVHGDLKVLRATTMPAVVVEAAYISNKAEAARCATAAHRQAIAEAIAAAFAEHATRSVQP